MVIARPPLHLSANVERPKSPPGQPTGVVVGRRQADSGRVIAGRAGKPEAGGVKVVQETPYRFRIEQEGRMRVPGIVFLSQALLPHARADQSLQQVANVATLPGIVRASYAMPDMHSGYGFPIGGVAPTADDDGGVVSPGAGA